MQRTKSLFFPSLIASAAAAAATATAVTVVASGANSIASFALLSSMSRDVACC